MLRDVSTGPEQQPHPERSADKVPPRGIFLRRHDCGEPPGPIQETV